MFLSRIYRSNIPKLVKNMDPMQAKYLNDSCILVDEFDHPIGSATKEYCHQMEIIRSGRALHRAFSVFVFNKNQELLLQKRASSKITFPSVWTNSCCSHPLYNDKEMATIDDIGIKRAARRKLLHELGIENIKLDQIHFMGRFLYWADSDGKWGEHEIDYALIICDFDLPIHPNPNEVEIIRYVDQIQLKRMMEEDEHRFSPWFSLFVKFDWLFEWWTNLYSLNCRKDTCTVHSLN